MKEYLTKNNSGEYQLVNHRFSDDDIEVPDGAECLTKCKTDGKEWLLFWMESCKWCVWFDEEWVLYENVEWYIESWDGRASIIWQRHTQPESLPFVDDEAQSINDQYAEIEQVRQAKNYGNEKNRENSHYFIDVSDVNEVDFYEIAKRYNVTDPAIQHILKKCLAIGNRGHKDLETDLKDILKTAKRALQINGFGE